VLPTVNFCGLEMTRLVIGANPFGGFSHQNAELDQAMRSYHTVDRIKETWARAEAAGINTMITNNETPHVLQAVKEYLADGGNLNWIGQLSCRGSGDMFDAISEAVKIGCRGFYIHGGHMDGVYTRKDEKSLRAWCEHGRKLGVMVGVAGHAPEVHGWVDTLDVVDFHVVCFFNCGSLHDGKGHTFRIKDMLRAVECVQRLKKPCIAYKIMGAGRIDPRLAFEYSLDVIKPTDVVNVGMHRGDKDDMVEENAAMVQEILAG